MPPKHSDYDVDIVENLNILLKLANPHTSGEVIQTNLAQRGEIVSFSLEFVACVNLCRHHLKMHHRFHIFTDGFYTPQIHKIISYQVQFTISVYFSNGHLQLIHPLNHLADACVVDILQDFHIRGFHRIDYILPKKYFFIIKADMIGWSFL